MFAGILGFVACGPSAEEKAKAEAEAEKAVDDQVKMAAEAAPAADSAAAQAPAADSAAKK